MKPSRRPDMAYSLEDQESVPTFHFMLKCLLYSRLQTGLVSNRDYYDEDVNVYMAHLLQAFINPDYIDRVKPHLSQYDSDVFQKRGVGREVIHRFPRTASPVASSAFANTILSNC